jgi:CBS domain-containing protein
VAGELADVVDLVRAGQQPSESVRALLRRFGFEKRGYHKVRDVRRALEAAGLTTDPEFNAVPIDYPISYKAATTSGAETEPDTASSTGVLTNDKGVDTVAADPAYRLRRLEDVTQDLVMVKPNDDVRQALTIMLERDFSQLPVMATERVVKGVISWRSIGLTYGLGGTPKEVRDAFETDVVILDEDFPLFAAIPRIVAKDYALVRRADGTHWIVTTSDLSVRFKELTEPFLLLSEIENQLRILLDGRVPLSILEDARDPGDNERTIDSAADLTLGEVVRVLEQPEIWQKLAPGLDRVVVINQLHRIRAIRNDVMHFDPEGVGPTDLEALRSFARFLQEFRRWGPK